MAHRARALFVLSFAVLLGVALALPGAAIAETAAGPGKSKQSANTGAKSKTQARRKKKRPSRDEIEDRYDDYAWPTFVKLKGLNVPVIRGDRIAGQIMLAIEIEVADDDDRAKVRESEDRLRNAFIADLKDFADSRPHFFRDPDLTILKNLLMAAARRVVGPDLIKAVLVQAVYFRKF